MDEAKLKRIRMRLFHAHSELHGVISEYGRSVSPRVRKAYEDLIEVGQELGMWDDPTSTYREIRDEDVNKHLFYAFGREWRVSEFMGRILPQDVGKRVHRIKLAKDDYILQVENDKQFAHRLRRKL